MNNYFRSNPVAHQFLISTLNLNENASVDNLLKKTTEAALDTFKKIVFDLTTKENRNPDKFRSMLNEVGSAKGVRGMIAKMKDFAEEADIADSKLAQVKQIYLDALGQVGEALKRLVEIDGRMGAMILDHYRLMAKRLISAMDDIASAYSKKILLTENFRTALNSPLNESENVGFHGRIDKLKKKLVNLISDAQGKDAKNGYGRDWQRLFSGIHQKLEALISDKSVVSEREKKSLLEIEKQSDNLAEEYYSYKIKAAELTMKKIIDDDELVTKFSDVTDLLTKSLDLIAKANVQEVLIDQKIREELEEVENKIVQKVFPVRPGAKDSDLKFKKSGFISAVQKALMSAFPSVKKLLSDHEKDSGTFGPATSLAIKSIQTSLGNKNANGDLDKPLLDLILTMEQVADGDKKKISAALKSLKSSYAMSESRVLQMSDFSRLSEAVYIDDDDLQKEIERGQEELKKSGSGSLSHLASDETTGADTALAKKLAKLLRGGDFNKNAEEEDFLKDDGTFKNSYPTIFIESWLQCLSATKESKDKPGFFWVQGADEKIGALYSTKRIAGNVKKPYNWAKWKEIAGDDSQEERERFARWYTSYFSGFGGLADKQRLNVASEILTYYGDPKNSTEAPENLQSEFKDYCSVYDGLKDVLRSGRTSRDSEPYQYFAQGLLTKESMKKISEAVSKFSQLDKSDPDLTFYDFMILTVCVFLTASCVAWDESNRKWAPAFSILTDGALSDSVVNRILDDQIHDADPSAPVPQLSKESGAMVISKGYDGKIKTIFKQNYNRAQKVLEPLVQRHADRMNYVDKDDIENFDRENVYVIPNS